VVHSGSCRPHELNTALYGVALPALRHRSHVWLLLFAMHQARLDPCSANLRSSPVPHPTSGQAAVEREACRMLRSSSGLNTWAGAAMRAQYVYPMLVLRRYLPAAVVRTEFLPVGNPATRYVFGPCHAGQQLQVKCTAAALASHRVYLTVYDRASLPVLWGVRLSALPFRFVPPYDGFYLVRLHPQ
jgi:hypothetical protein